MPSLFCLILLLCLPGFMRAHAPQAPVWRCLDGDRIVYQDHPCASGERLDLPAAAEPTPEARRQAHRRAEAERQAAARLARDSAREQAANARQASADARRQARRQQACDAHEAKRQALQQALRHASGKSIEALRARLRAAEDAAWDCQREGPALQLSRPVP